MKTIMFSPQEAEALAASGSVLFIDVRDPEEFAKEHITNAVNIPEIFTFLSDSSKEGRDIRRQLPLPVVLPHWLRHYAIFKNIHFRPGTAKSGISPC